MPSFTLFITPLATLFGVLLAVWVKDKAQEIAVRVFTEKILGTLASFKSELLDSLDRRFITEPTFTVKMDYHDDRLDALEDQIKELTEKLERMKFFGEQKK